MQLTRIVLLSLGLLITACSSNPNAPKSEPRAEIQSPTIHNLTGNPAEHKSIFVFLDGTENGPESKTNVWQLYDLISKNNDPQTTATYIRGVGTAEDPFDTRHLGRLEKVIEMALGRSMQDRILKGYEFIAINYNPGDDLYIFGFSRGAHEARSLAGLIAYAGIPKLSDNEREQLARDKDYLWNIGNDILELTKKKSDEEYLRDWKSWVPGQAPLLAAEIKEKKINGKKGREMQSAEVAFLGIWDTVPGSSLKDYGYCKEEKGFIKKYFYWLIPGIDRGERYKTDSYPPIRRIAHAVSLDEKRSKFKPILACPAINSDFTKVTEVWFPGAHADVGGGYDDDDSDKLPSISLEWMIQLLGEKYKNATPVSSMPDAATGLAHWSIGDPPANMFSDCVDRNADEQTTDNSKRAEIHPSVEERRKKGIVPIKVRGKIEYLIYPVSCRSI
jgi:uncharacterized protein (DUF2235 family)